MIRCRVEQQSGVLSAFESRGHGTIDNSDASVSLSCATVSLLIRTVGSILERCEDVLIRLESFDYGDVSVRILEVGDNAVEWLSGVTEVLVQGLEGVQNDFPQQVKFIHLLR